MEGRVGVVEGTPTAPMTAVVLQGSCTGLISCLNTVVATVSPFASGDSVLSFDSSVSPSSSDARSGQFFAFFCFDRRF